jgi:hypothetical protein
MAEGRDHPDLGADIYVPPPRDQQTVDEPRSNWSLQPSPWAPQDYSAEPAWTPAHAAPEPEAEPEPEPEPEPAVETEPKSEAIHGDPPTWPPERHVVSLAPAHPGFPPLPQPIRQGPPPIAPAATNSSRSWWIAAGIVVLALGIAAGTLVGLNFAARDRIDASGSTCGGQPVLRVAAAPEFAPLVELAAKDLGGAPIGCSLVTVAAQDPTTPPTTADAWIPPSGAWLKLKSSTAPSGFAENPISLARSPVVIAAPESFAKSLGWPGKQPSWAELVQRVSARQIPKFSMASPLKDTAALLAVLGVQAAMARTTTDPGIAQMRALTLRARLTDAEADPAALLDRAGKQTDPAKALPDVGLFPLTERAMFEYARTTHPVPLAAIYPPDGLLEADYPLVLTARTAIDDARRDLATRLTVQIRSRDFIGALTERGFRPAAQTAAAAGSSTATAPKAPGLVATYQQPSTLPGQITESVVMWAQYQRLTYQTLILVDGSGSMNETVNDRSGKVTTKAELLRLAGVQASQLFGEDTSLGMWLFATPTATSPPYTVALPFGPINDAINGVPRRQAMRTVAETYKAYPTAGTPLFETVLRGLADMRQRFKSGAVSLVVVLTDGRDEDSPFAMSRQQFLERLGAGRDPARPVPIFAIGYGADADMAVLNEMAKLTGGLAIASNDPSDLASAMAKIFLAAHQQR